MDKKSVNEIRVRMNYERAHKIRTCQHHKKIEMEEQKREQTKCGLSADDYWKQNVKSKEDIIQYFELYKPDYPKELAIAIADRMDRLVKKVQSGEELTEDELNYINRKKDKDSSEVFWDPLKEMEEQKLAGKIQLTNKRLEQLMNE